MPTIHVIVAMRSAVTREAVRHQLSASADIKVVAETGSPVEMLCRAETEQADAVILESDDETKMPGVLSHLFAEFPRVLAIVIERRTNRIAVYRQQLRKHVCEGTSLAELLAAVRTADARYWARSG